MGDEWEQAAVCAWQRLADYAHKLAADPAAGLTTYADLEIEAIRATTTQTDVLVPDTDTARTAITEAAIGFLASGCPSIGHVRTCVRTRFGA